MERYASCAFTSHCSSTVAETILGNTDNTLAVHMHASFRGAPLVHTSIDQKELAKHHTVLYRLIESIRGNDLNIYLQEESLDYATTM